MLYAEATLFSTSATAASSTRENAASSDSVEIAAFTIPVCVRSSSRKYVSKALNAVARFVSVSARLLTSPQEML